MADQVPPVPDCLFCGRPEHVDLFEVWDHEFMLDTCCEGLLEQIATEMEDDSDWARRFLRGLDVETLCGHKMRRVAADGGGGIVVDWKLVLRPISRVDARRFIKSHHAHCATPVTWRFQTSVWNGGTLMGVAVVGNPVAPGLNGRGIVEVNRLCVRRDTAAALRWNAASMLYGWCGREAARQGWRKIITYTRIDEPGTSLRASGWSPEARVRGRGWHSNRRARSNTNAWIDKTRWAKTLKPENASIAARTIKRNASSEMPGLSMHARLFGNSAADQLIA
jgi:hypothetical protein